MYRCINDRLQKSEFVEHHFHLAEAEAIKGRKASFRNDDQEFNVVYRIFVDLNNYALLVGYSQSLVSPDQYGHEHLIFTEESPFRCNKICIDNPYRPSDAPVCSSSLPKRN